MVVGLVLEWEQRKKIFPRVPFVWNAHLRGMVHAFDFGNTAVKYARYHDRHRVHTERIDDFTVDFFRTFRFDAAHDHLVFCTTRQLAPAVRSCLRRYHAREISPADVPLQIAYATPQTLGRDRLAAVAGARAEFPHRNVLVVDAGTCLTYEWITAAGVYLGGNISPGLHMRLDAMHHFTAKLPRATATLPDFPIGTSTQTALQNGALRGLLYEVHGAIAWTHTHHTDPVVLSTGGGGAFLAQHLPDTHHRAHLVLDGLATLA